MTKKKNQKAVKDTNSKREVIDTINRETPGFVQITTAKGKLYHSYILPDENNCSKTPLLKVTFI